MTGRTRQILARLPAHLEPARPGKVLSAVVDALAQDLDVLAARLAAVRRAHRLGEADEIADLLRIGALHGISAGEVELLFMRFARAQKLMVDVEKAAGPARDAAAEALIALWPVPAAEPRLPLYAPAGGGDPAAARARLLEHATAALRYDRLTAALRARIGAICRLHTQGNGTVQAVMAGAANALDLEIGPVIHSDDRFWHASPVHDRLRLTRPVEVTSDGVTSETAVPFDPAQEVIGIEENPWYRASTDIIGRSHGELWSVIRRGFEHAVARIHITGVERGRTIGPMLVNRDEGRGIGYLGTVPDGKTLVFTEEGRALLDGADVTSSAYAWEGGCFADAGGATGELDFVFDGGTRPAGMRAAAFVTTTPPNALDCEAVHPHADVTLPMPGIGLGETRFAFFVQEAHFNSLEGTPAAIRLVTPRTRAAFHEASVFAPAAGEAHQAVADLSLSWMERRAFHARLLIPARFRGFEDDPEAAEIRRRVAVAVERFRPAGVELVVEFVDDRWVLGGSVLRTGDPVDLIEQLQSGMVLWEAPAG